MSRLFYEWRCLNYDGFAKQQNAPGNIVLASLLTTPTSKRPRGRPGTILCDYIFDLALSSPGVKPAELSEVAESHDVFRDLHGLLPFSSLTASVKINEWSSVILSYPEKQLESAFSLVFHSNRHISVNLEVETMF